MKNILVLMLMVCMLCPAARALAGPDLYVGDTSLYTTGGGIRANVLLVIDNSAGMVQTGGGLAYDSATTYHGPYTTTAVYVREAATGGTINYNQYMNSVNSVTCAPALTALRDGSTDSNGTYTPPPGAYYGYLKKDGTCNASQAGNYYTGNLLNYLAGSVWKANTAYNRGESVVVGGLTYQCTTAGTSGATQPATWPTTTGATVTDGSVIWTLLTNASLLNQVQQVLSPVLQAARNTARVGLAVFGNNNHGAQIILPIMDISLSSASGPTNYANLISAINNITLLTANSQPVNEALWDAGVYYRGQNGSSSQKISSDTVPYPSPILYSCQPNEIIVVTTGNTPDTTLTKKYLADLDRNGIVGDAADAAIYNDTTDNATLLSGVQGIVTNVIQVLTAEVPILREAATSTTSTWDPTNVTHGAYANPTNTTELTAAFNAMFAGVTDQADTSFVAPVVPVSPENRTYSANRVYMGFFKPMNKQYWYGNLKKYGISTLNYLVDKNNSQACYVDIDGNGWDDFMPNTQLPAGAVNGTFLPGALSFWSTPPFTSSTINTSTGDGGAVNQGGAGEVLLDSTYMSRNIYTYRGTNPNLYDPSNLFNSTNVTADLLGLSTPDDAAKLINFIYGKDAYNNDNPTGERSWLFGDVLHSRPVIVNYNTYSSTYEGVCGTDPSSSNQSIIYVGANDGMLHAIRDCNGQELWAFIPPDMLGHLSNLKGPVHSYFADATPSVYIFDKNHNGVIQTDASNNDKVILMFGERRGGGVDSAPTTGSYYVLDVSDPSAPKFMWSINNQTTLSDGTHPFAELAETWSEPKLVKMRIGSVDKIVAFVGAGYDNIHEDTRYGSTRLFTNAATVDLGDTGEGNFVSAGTTDAGGLSNPKGRGVYAIEIATINSSGAPDFTSSGQKIWGYTFANDSTMKFSIPSQLAAIDSRNSGYTDTLYVGDTGGQVWRFNVGDPNPVNWSAKRLYDLSNGVAGRKFFYMPSIVTEPGYNLIYLGSGDREHPLNWNSTLVDRMYGLKDFGASQPTSTLTESNLTNVTSDQIQTTTCTTSITGTCTTSPSAMQTTLAASYGWYIRLTNYDPATNTDTGSSIGEKVLASPLVFNKVAYFTTFTPTMQALIDPCQAGNTGTAKLYAVDYKTGAAVMNYDTSNDTSANMTLYSSNTLTTPTGGGVLLRSDRVQTIGTGIASGIVVLVSAGGDTKALIGVGGVIASENTKKGGTIKPLYWRKK